MLPAAHPSVIYKTLSDGAVLFSASDEVYFGLNTVGARVWELLPPALSTVDELCDALARQFPEVSAEVIRSDVEELLGDLAAYGLVVSREAEPANVQGVSDGPSQAEHASTQRLG